jgi:hypothetical protein
METEVPLRQKSYLIPLIITLTLVLTGSSYFYLKTAYPFLFTGLSQKITSITNSPTPSPTMTITAPPVITAPSSVPYVLPTGSQTYQYSHGSDVKGPKISSVTIDPLDPPKDTAQTITLVITSTSPMTKNSLTINTDNESKTLDLKQVSGDNLAGTYAVTWTPSDTYAQKYSIKYHLVSTTDTFDSTMYLRP